MSPGPVRRVEEPAAGFEPEAVSPIPKPDREVAAVEHVSFGFGATPVLEDVSLSLVEGELTALVGPNGAGKSTLLRIALGLLRPTSGRVRLFGEDPRTLRGRRRIGYVAQRGSVAEDLPATVDEVVASGLLTREGWWRPLPRSARGAVDEALAATGMSHLRRRLHRDLSGGEQQRTLVARALAGHPRLLVLDEPLVGVDAESQRLLVGALVDEVRRRGACVLVVSHELGALSGELDRVVVLRRCILFDGSPAEIPAGHLAAADHVERRHGPEPVSAWRGPLG
jgi:zinc transport system ATP-binding protein